MSPTAVVEPIVVDNANIADLKGKVVDGHVELDASPPPVADDFKYDFGYNHALPTTDVLGVRIPAEADANAEAQALTDRLAQVFGKGDAVAFADLFLEYGVWRDKLAFTWDYRTFNFGENILRAAKDLLPSNKATQFKLFTPLPAIQRPYPDFEYLQFVVSFDTELVNATATINAVYTKDGWKLYTVHTVAESLLQFPELPPLDGHMTGPTSWEKNREIEDDSIEPEVVIIGAGQNGLALAARLKVLGVKALLIERSGIIGEVWRNRYEYLSLHFPHWADHFPYFPFPDHWPTYTPAQKLGIFMEWYASALELPVWTKTTVLKAEQEEFGEWSIEINKDGDIRQLHPKHLVMATSLCGMPMTPVIPGMSEWKAGVYRHSAAHNSSRDFIGKRVLVVGTSSSGFDTAYDCARRGIDVTLLQRSPTYVMSLTHSVPRAIGGYEPKNGVRPNLEDQDRLMHAFPCGPGEELARRNAKVLEDLDKEMLDGLHAKGFKTWRGQRNTGQVTLGQTRNGAFYFEAGACDQIIKGNIKVEQGYIERFTEDKVILSGGREEHFDLIIFATGFSNTIDSVRATLGEDIASRCGPIWGVDAEGEMKSCYKESGVPNLWIFAGYLPLTRYHSKRLAIRIKALLVEGISPAPYTA